MVSNWHFVLDGCPVSVFKGDSMVDGEKPGYDIFFENTQETNLSINLSIGLQFNEESNFVLGVSITKHYLEVHFFQENQP